MLTTTALQYKTLAITKYFICIYIYMYNIIEKKHDVFEEKNEKLLLRFGLYEMGS